MAECSRKKEKSIGTAAADRVETPSMGSPKAWSLGSPVLIGQSVCITENTEDEVNDKEKTRR